ncbi:alpha/beta fold hydrolase [Sphingomonas sp. MMS24-J13]|uniref:alpha/beta hydrolase family protein n=1 Tax=Sphingomonas sp. MMS24-J13 TaxID=3238686 RepID=UPI00384F8F37
MRRHLYAAMAAIFASSPAFAAASAHELAAAFGARPAVSQVSLSPDGKRLAFVTPLAGQGGALYVVATTDGAEPKRIAVASGAPERLAECRWASNSKLICLIHGQQPLLKSVAAPGGAWGVPFEKLVVVPADGGDGVRPPQQLPLGEGVVVDWLPGETDNVLVGFPAGRPYGPFDYHLARYDLTKGKAHGWDDYVRCDGGCLTDGLGQIRIDANEIRSGTISYRYRGVDGDWRPFGSYRPLTGEGFAPAAVDPTANLVWGFRKLNGRLAVFTKALDAAANETEVYARADVDIDGIVRLGRKRRIIGVSYVTDALHFLYADPDLAALADSLAKALPSTPIIRFVDASDDERQLLILASSDVAPGRYYLLDRNTRKLQRLMDIRPQLDGMPLAPMKAITYPAEDGTAIPAYLTMPTAVVHPGKAIVLPHGGPSARDEWGFDWLAQYYAARGYAVLQPEFRGSDGYGDDWFRDQGFAAWRAAVSDIDAGARWLVGQGIADKGHLAIVGWSFGGYAALQAAATAPDLYKAVVAVAPVTDVGMIRGRLVHYMDRGALNQFVGSKIEDDASPINNAGRIGIPAMLVHGTFDLNVSYEHSQRMQARLKAVGRPPTFLSFDRLDHQLDDSAARAKLLEESDAFIARVF